MTATAMKALLSNEIDIIIQPRVIIPRSPLIYCHSAVGNSYEAVGEIDSVRDIRFINTRCADHGFTVMAADYGISFGAGGTDAGSGYEYSGRVQEAIDYHRANLLGTSGKAALVGCSMGANNALQYALNHPENVSCVVGVIPAIDTVDIYESDHAGLRGYVEAGWGVSYPASLPPEADLVSRASELQVPARFYYANDDEITSPAAVAAYTTAGAEMIDVGAFGHTNQAIQAVAVNDILEFIQTHTV